MINSSISIIFRSEGSSKIKKALCKFCRGRKIRGTTSVRRFLTETASSGVKQRRRAITGAPGSPTPPKGVSARGSGMYFPAHARRLTPAGGSLRRESAGTSFLHRLYHGLKHTFSPLSRGTSAAPPRCRLIFDTYFYRGAFSAVTIAFGHAASSNAQTHIHFSFQNYFIACL